MPAAQPAHACARQCGDVLAAVQHLAAGAVEQAKDGAADGALARSRLAHQPQRLAAANGERHAVHGAHRPVPGAEVAPQVAHLDQRHVRRPVGGLDDVVHAHASRAAGSEHAAACRCGAATSAGIASRQCARAWAARLDDAAGIHHQHVGRRWSATTPRLCVISTTPCRSRAAAAHQRQDLRLDGDVERGGRLVGDQQRAGCRPAPWRSSRAGACRPRAGADTRRCARRAAHGMRPARAAPSARARARGPVQPSCSRSDSAIWSPMVSTGFSEVIGSWKIIAISLPRMARISARAA
jgi:hypothetical protein